MPKSFCSLLFSPHKILCVQRPFPVIPNGDGKDGKQPTYGRGDRNTVAPLPGGTEKRSPTVDYRSLPDLKSVCVGDTIAYKVWIRIETNQLCSKR